MCVFIISCAINLDNLRFLHQVYEKFRLSYNRHYV